MKEYQKRSEEQMLSLIKEIALNDDRVRAVYMNGSRTNPNVEKDSYRDYDIVFVVTEVAPFLTDTDFINLFGELALMQEPDSPLMGWRMKTDKNKDAPNSYTWLMLFKDGNRIDLHIETPALTQSIYGTDTLTLPLLDKDGILPPIPLANDSGYYIKKPTKFEYAGCCNEFWWCLNNVAKGICRGQLPYAIRMYMNVVHVELEKMLEWDIAAANEFKVTTGMWGKYFKDYLTPEIYSSYMSTYPQKGELGGAIKKACSLFSTLARGVAVALGFCYNESEEEGLLSYLKQLGI